MRRRLQLRSIVFELLAFLWAVLSIVTLYFLRLLTSRSRVYSFSRADARLFSRSSPACADCRPVDTLFAEYCCFLGSSTPTLPP